MFRMNEWEILRRVHAFESFGLWKFCNLCVSNPTFLVVDYILEYILV